MLDNFKFLKVYNKGCKEIAYSKNWVCDKDPIPLFGYILEIDNNFFLEIGNY